MLDLKFTYFALDMEEEFRRKQLEIENISREQEALAHLEIQSNYLKPDIALICKNLFFFAEIWSSVSAPV